jgi:hypothetical protein
MTTLGPVTLMILTVTRAVIISGHSSEGPPLANAINMPTIFSFSFLNLGSCLYPVCVSFATAQVNGLAALAIADYLNALDPPPIQTTNLLCRHLRFHSIA